MAITLQITRGCFNGTRRVQKVVDVAYDQTIEENLTLGIGNDQLVAMTFLVAKLEEIFINASQDCTLEVNSSSAPQETIALKANSPFEWRRDDGYFTAPFAGNVTAFYFTTTVSTEIDIFVSVDPT